MFTGVNLGCMAEIGPTWGKFKIWRQHEISELVGVNLRRGSNLGLNKDMKMSSTLCFEISIYSSSNQRQARWKKQKTLTQFGYYEELNLP